MEIGIGALKVCVTGKMGAPYKGTEELIGLGGSMILAMGASTASYWRKLPLIGLST